MVCLEVDTMKHIELTRKEWDDLKQRLITEHGPRILISWVLKRECGFTMRDHREHDRSYIALDFYDEQMRTFFHLKYL